MFSSLQNDLELKHQTMLIETKQQYEQQIAELNKEVGKLKASENEKIEEVSGHNVDFWLKERKIHYLHFHFFLPLKFFFRFQTIILFRFYRLKIFCVALVINRFFHFLDIYMKSKLVNMSSVTSYVHNFF